MESIGELLKNSREEMKVSLSEVAEDTNIPPLYIEALEKEEFDHIPGETYIIGFLRSYAEYLHLDPEEVINSYKGYKIGESTTPLEELTKPTKKDLMSDLASAYQRKKWLFIGGLITVVTIIVVVLAVVLTRDNVQIEENEQQSVAAIKTAYQAENVKENGTFTNILSLKLANDSGYILVYKNEAVVFMVGTKEVMFAVKEVNSEKQETVIEIVSTKEQKTLKVGEPVELDVAGISRRINFTLKGIGEKRVNIYVKLGEISAEEQAKIIKQKEEEQKNIDTTSVVAMNKNNLKIVFEANFTKPSYFELYLDGQEVKHQIMPANTHQRWEASEHIQVKIGNAGGVKAIINGKPYTFGQAGKVANKIITWEKDSQNPNIYNIVVKDWK